jgi:hypothetical protein
LSINKDIAKFIFARQYYLKKIGENKRRWYKEIFNQFWMSGLREKCAKDEFRQTWKELQEIGLIGKKEKFVE